MTVDEIIERCADGSAEDWAFWVYLCGDETSPSERCARAVHLRQRSVGLAWTRAAEDDPAYLPLPCEQLFDDRCVYHWIELLDDDVVVYRCLAVHLVNAGVSLPAPHVEPGADGAEGTLWVSRPAYLLLRLANEVDPECGDFEARFAQTGIEVR